jgi:hypothetical protein
MPDYSRVPEAWMTRGQFCPIATLRFSLLDTTRRIGSRFARYGRLGAGKRQGARKSPIVCVVFLEPT